jgi:flagellar basal body P-ring formation protein FlgA
MIRFLTSTILAACALPAFAQTAPLLRSDIMVSADVVRIGDLVENAGAAAKIAVFRAPDLGETGSVPVARVIEALRSHSVVAIDTAGISDVAVTRTSRAIGSKEIEERIAQALAGRLNGVDPTNIALTFERPVRTIHAEAGLAAPLAVSRLSFEPRSGRFDILFELPGSAAVQREPLRFSGLAAEAYEAVTLARPIARGEVLRAADLIVERRPKNEVTNDALRSPEAAIGLAVRQPLRGGQVLRRADLTKPDLVARNETVLIVLDTPGISLTVRGKSLDAGAEGDTVNVVNIQSKRNLQAVVTGPGQVKVVSMTPRATTDLTQAPAVTGAAAHPVKE